MSHFCCLVTMEAIHGSGASSCAGRTGWPSRCQDVGCIVLVRNATDGSLLQCQNHQNIGTKICTTATAPTVPKNKEIKEQS
eukprot:2610962-Amphidinium_carterae.1